MVAVQKSSDPGGALNGVLSAISCPKPTRTCPLDCLDAFIYPYRTAPENAGMQHFGNKGGTYAYGYDSAYRLTSESRTGFRSYSASHTYDAMGNRLTRTLDGVTRSYTYNDADQVVSWSEGTKAGSYTYDIDGNAVQKVVTDGGTPTDQWDYEFDSVGRMVDGQQSVGGSQSTANVYAGAQWYRVQSTTSGTTIKYGWKRDELFAEFDGSNLTAGYLNDGVDRPFYKTRFSSDGSVVEGRDFYHADANLRVHHVTDSSGNVAEKYVYNAYGRRTILDSSDTVLTSTGIGNRIGFQGREHEDLVGYGQDAGLTFHRNRFYDPDVGRWMRRDPVGYGAGFNTYRFTFNRPNTFVDPSGLISASFANFTASLFLGNVAHNIISRKWFNDHLGQGKKGIDKTINQIVTTFWRPRGRGGSARRPDLTLYSEFQHQDFGKCNTQVWEIKPFALRGLARTKAVGYVAELRVINAAQRLGQRSRLGRLWPRKEITIRLCPAKFALVIQPGFMTGVVLYKWKKIKCRKLEVSRAGARVPVRAIDRVSDSVPVSSRDEVDVGVPSGEGGRVPVGIPVINVPTTGFPPLRPIGGGVPVGPVSPGVGVGVQIITPLTPVLMIFGGLFGSQVPQDQNVKA